MTVAEAVRDRRECIRKNLDFPVQLRFMHAEDKGLIHNSMTHDFSESGVQLSSFYFYPVNSKMILEMFPSMYMQPILTVGRVVWIEQAPYQDRYKVGIEFSDLNYENRVFLKEMIYSNEA